MTPHAAKLETVRALIADAERRENMLSTRIDAAISAMALMDPGALNNLGVKQYLALKYSGELDEFALIWHYDNALLVAKTLLSNLEAK